jgi:hypothetical protein
MKTIYSMGKGKYITLDSYPETHETRGGNIFVVLLSLLLAAITGMALVGCGSYQHQPSTYSSNQ